MFYRSPRRPSDMKIRLRANGSEDAVKILDLSETGLKLTLPRPLPEGTRVTLIGARIEMHGVLRWSADGQAGVHLDRKLDRAEQAELAGATWGR